jgi:hypothetical protein
LHIKFTAGQSRRTAIIDNPGRFQNDVMAGEWRYMIWPSLPGQSVFFSPPLTSCGV